MKNVVTVLAVAALCICTWAADNTVVGTKPAANHQSLDAITTPQMMSYQGRLADTLGQPVPNGNYQLTFRLYTDSTGGSAIWTEAKTIQVVDGLFSTLLGDATPISSVPDSGALYLSLQVGVDPELAPRLRIASSAYAYKADTANYAHAADTANYALASAGGDNAWVRGTPDSVLYTIHNLGIARAGSVLYGTGRFTHVNLGEACTTGLSGSNYTNATVGGGSGNAAIGLSTVGGGYRNKASGSYATVAGGNRNIASGDYATACGAEDTASGDYSTVSGGHDNGASGSYSTVGGGRDNHASATYATVPGGSYNEARGAVSFAAGRYARANHRGSFVWSDSAASLSESVYTTGTDQWRVRARGGAWFFSNAAKTTGAYLAPGSNAWTSACDSATKEDFRAVDRKVLLDKVASLRVRNYKMKDQNDGTRHIGPVAQDFHSAFGYGETETGINTADADGVALAAIQALYEQNQQLFDQNRQMMVELEALKAELRRR